MAFQSFREPSESLDSDCVDDDGTGEEEELGEVGGDCIDKVIFLSSNSIMVCNVCNTMQQMEGNASFS